jgi:hypothetical protein
MDTVIVSLRYKEQHFMRLVSTIARYLLGLLFTVFGLNGFLHFITDPPPTTPLGLQYFSALSASRLSRFSLEEKGRVAVVFENLLSLPPGFGETYFLSAARMSF